jgi:hypothetical protein
MDNAVSDGSDVVPAAAVVEEQKSYRGRAHHTAKEFLRPNLIAFCAIERRYQLQPQ